MKLKGSIGLILERSQRAGSLVSFIRDDVATVLERTARTEYRAAMRCFHDAKRSNNPRREIQSGFTLLKLSHERFSELLLNRNLVEFLGSTVLNILTFNIIKPPDLRRGEIALETCILLVAFYKYEHEHELMDVYAKRVGSIFDEYKTSYVCAHTVSTNGATQDATRRGAEEEMKKLRKEIEGAIDIIMSKN